MAEYLGVCRHVGFFFEDSTMTGQNALLRLRKNLLTRKQRLTKNLADELAYLHDSRAADANGDSADLAFEAGGDEMSSLLAEQDDKELGQIERALGRMRQGVYGICEGGSADCIKTIPAARLKSLPYTPFCINCEREMETTPEWQDQRGKGNWK